VRVKVTQRQLDQLAAGRPVRALAPLEGEIQRAVVELLESAGCVVLRVNGGRLPDKRGRPVKFNAVFCRDVVVDAEGKRVEPTCSDLIVWLPDGGCVAVEVKRPGEEPTAGQSAFLAAVDRRGGRTAVVRSVGDAQAILTRASGRNREAR
jgi:hypothetical protein